MKKGAAVKVDNKAWIALKKRLRTIGQTGAHVKVGVLGEAVHDGPKPISMVELAAVHEFGSPSIGVPERSFIRAGLKDDRDGMVRLLNDAARGIVAGTMSVETGLGRLGLWAQNAIKRKITGGDIPPPLKPRTIARKGSSKPLVDTGQLVNSITFEVVMAGGPKSE